MERLDDTARRLLREMGYQAEDNPTRGVLPEEAAQNLALVVGAPEYEAALNHLLALGDIERDIERETQDPGVPQAGQGIYRLTKQGLRRAREIRWR
jgi:hypothetical protein